MLHKGCGSKSVYFQRIVSIWRYTNLLPHPLLLYSLSHMVCSKPNLNQKIFILPSGAESKNFLFRKSHCCFFPNQCSVKTSKFSIFYHYCPPPLEIRAFIFEQKLFRRPSAAHIHAFYVFTQILKRTLARLYRPSEKQILKPSVDDTHFMRRAKNCRTFIVQIFMAFYIIHIF